MWNPEQEIKIQSLNYNTTSAGWFLDPLGVYIQDTVLVREGKYHILAYVVFFLNKSILKLTLDLLLMYTCSFHLCGIVQTSIILAGCSFSWHLIVNIHVILIHCLIVIFQDRWMLSTCSGHLLRSFRFCTWCCQNHLYIRAV